MITGILEVDVKPRLHMWSWQHIRRHRWMVKSYRELYKTKITSKKPSDLLLKQLEVRHGRSEVGEGGRSNDEEYSFHFAVLLVCNVEKTFMTTDHNSVSVK